MAKNIIQIIIAGGRLVGESFARAFRQEMEASRRAAQKHGGGREGKKKAAADMAAGMSLQEAKEILNVSDITSETELMKNYEHLFNVNDKAKGGSFYIQSKVVRAKERIETELQNQEHSDASSQSDKTSSASNT